MISFSLIKSIAPVKFAALFAWSISYAATAFAITEAFVGQLVIAVVVALIGAIAPIATIIFMSRKQSEERRSAQAAFMQEQEKMHKSLDGKLSELVQAKTEVARAEGMQQERTEERDRVAEAAPVVAAAAVIAAAAAADDPGKVSKMEIVNQDDNPVPTKIAKP